MLPDHEDHELATPDSLVIRLDRRKHTVAYHAGDTVLDEQGVNLEYQRAMLLERAGRTRESVRAFDTLLKLRPDDATVQNALGYTLADRRQQLPRAEQLIRRAVAARPDNASFLDSLAWVLYRRGDARSAVPLLERAWRLSQEAEIAAHWGEVLWASGAQSEARTVWARALARAPDSEPLRATIERFTGKPGSTPPASPTP